MNKDFINYLQECTRENNIDNRYSETNMKVGDQIYRAILLVADQSICIPMKKDFSNGFYYEIFHFNWKIPLKKQFDTVYNFYQKKRILPSEPVSNDD